MSEKDQQLSVEEAVAFYAAVDDGFRTKNQVNYQDAQNSMRALLNTYGTESSNGFIEEYFAKIVEILLDQHLSTVADIHRSAVKNALYSAAGIVKRTIEDGETKYISTLSSLFNSQRSLYKSRRGMYTDAPGSPEVREQCIRMFGFEGFETLVGLVDSIEWCGCRAAAAIVSSFTSGRNLLSLPQDMADKVCDWAMKSVSELPSEELRKESNDHVNSLIRSVGHLSGNANLSFEFWMAITLKYLRSSSLPQRLFGLDQLSALRVRARRERRAARAYKVEGAGKRELNGIYEYDGDFKGCAKYTYLSMEDNTMYTLFRCTLRRGSQYWFLSNADEDSPGTERDIDFYNAKCGDVAPPAYGWGRCGVGEQPAPVVTAVAEESAEGAEPSLEDLLAAWIRDSKVIEDSFGDRIHREVVARMETVFQFLLDTNNLTAEDLSMLWQSAVRGDSPKDDKAAPTLVLLSGLLRHCQPALLVRFLNEVCNELPANTPFVVALLESVCDSKAGDGGELLLSRGAAVTSALIQLLWKLQYFGAADDTVSAPIVEFFRRALCNAPPGSSSRPALLSECVNQLQQSADAEMGDELDSVRVQRSFEMLKFIVKSYVRSEQEQVVDVLEDKYGISSMLCRELAAFAGRRHQAGTASGTTYLSQLAERLSILHFVYGKSRRLHVSMDMVNKMWLELQTREEQDCMWRWLSRVPVADITLGLQPALDRETILAVFVERMCSSAKYDSVSEAHFACFRIYFLLVNSAEVDGQDGKLTLATSLDEDYSDDSDLPTPAGGTTAGSIAIVRDLSLEGLSTLWQIALEVECSDVAEKVNSLLLEVYQNVIMLQGSAADAFYARAFSYLCSSNASAQAAAGLFSNDGNDGSQSPPVAGMRLKRQNSMDEFALEVDSLPAEEGDLLCKSRARRIQRSLALLQGFVSDVDAAVPSHGRSGRGRAFQVHLKGRKIGPAKPYTPGSPGYCTKCHHLHGSSGMCNVVSCAICPTTSRPTVVQLKKLELTCYENWPLSRLKQRVAIMYDHPLNSVRLLFQAHALNGDTATLKASKLYPGCEVTAMLFNKPVNSTMAERNAMARASVRSEGMHAGEALAAHSEYLEVLFELLAPPHQALADENISLAVWELLSQLPSNKALKSRAAAALAGDGQDTAALWASLVSPDSYYRSVYVLQLVDALLAPACDDADDAAAAAAGSKSAPDSPNRLARADSKEEVEAQPVAAAMVAAVPSKSELCREQFISSGGFKRLLHFFIQDGSSAGPRNVVHKEGQAVVLRILKCCLFGGSSDGSTSVAFDLGVDYPVLLRQLVSVAAGGSGDDDTVLDAMLTVGGLLSDELVPVFLSMPQLPDLLRTLCFSRQAPLRKAISAAFQDASSRSGDAFSAVFCLLCSALDSVPPTSTTVGEFFSLLHALLLSDGSGSVDADLASMVKQVVSKLREAEKEMNKDDASGAAAGADAADDVDDAGEDGGKGDDEVVVLGCLRLLNALCLSMSIEEAQQAGVGADFAQELFDRFLFSVPSMAAPQRWPVARTTATRQASLTLITTLARDPVCLEALLTSINQFTATVSPSVTDLWWGEPSLPFTARKAYVGLKNQGCTCYMNSFLQQLYMAPTFRNGILDPSLAPPSDGAGEGDKPAMLDHDTVDPESLVGKRLSVQWHSKKWYTCEVMAYDKESKLHTLKYEDDEVSHVVLSEGREEHESSCMFVVPTAPSDKEASQLLFKQLRRTFAALQGGVQRHHDPLPFVESAKCLNLNYSVFEQNDASEFADQILDRVEMGLKGGPKEKLMEECFGGKIVYQKIPKGCSHKSETSQPFIRLELTVRDVDSVEQALENYIAGEMMDGDNKVFCEECDEKKATLRRTCFSTLPNILLVHLKRFDLCYETFETIKLNTRVSFPNTLDMFPFTKEGIEAKDAAAAAAAAAAAGAESDSDSDKESNSPAVAVGADADVPDAIPEVVVGKDKCKYRLQGILIHSGVARGGHYYSYIKERSGEERWFTFDDDRISPFDAANIEDECFGGTGTRQSKTMYGQSSGRAVEITKMSNAFMLFYEKINPDEGGDAEEQASEAAECKDAEPATAVSAATPEDDLHMQQVWKDNDAFIRGSYVYHSTFANFVRDILKVGGESALTDDSLGLAMAQMGTSFLFTVLLNTRSTPSYSPSTFTYGGMTGSSMSMFDDDDIYSGSSGGSANQADVDAWVTALGGIFSASAPAARWFIERLSQTKDASGDAGSWLKQLLGDSVSDVVRSAVIGVVSSAAQAIMSGEHAAAGVQVCRGLVSAVVSHLAEEEANPTPAKKTSSSSYYAGMPNYSMVSTGAVSGGLDLDFVSGYSSCLSCSDSFNLLSSLADCAPLRQLMLDMELPALLAHLVLGWQAPAHVLEGLTWGAQFPIPEAPVGDGNSPDVVCVLQALGAMLGIARQKEEPLLVPSISGVRQLSPRAVAAFTAIFNQFSSPPVEEGGARGMTREDVVSYFRACGALTPSSTSTERLNEIFGDFDTDVYGRLTLGGVLGFYADAARREPSAVWKDLTTHGWLRSLRTPAEVAAEAAAQMAVPLDLPPRTAAALESPKLLEAGLSEDPVLTTSIYIRISLSSLPRCIHLVQGIVTRLGAAGYNMDGEQNVKACYGALSRVLDAVPEHMTQELVEEAFTKDCGILTFAAERAVETRMDSNGTFAPRDVLRCCQCLLALYKEGGVARDYLSNHMEQWSWLVGWLRAATLLPALGGNANMRYRQPNRVKVLNEMAVIHGQPTCSIRGEAAAFLVTGAGSEELNGLYLPRGRHDGIPMYQHTGTVRTPVAGTDPATPSFVTKQIVFTVFRCTLPSGTKHWYISHADERSPGTVKDRDYYSIRCNLTAPPPTGWVVCKHGMEPLPTVQRASRDGQVEPEEIDVQLPPPLPPGYEMPDEMVTSRTLDDNILD